jgi:demethylmenaquinone methyltransferase / 2-methoxy-6-polyprenyl-1,4-benzoquinol methylase
MFFATRILVYFRFANIYGYQMDIQPNLDKSAGRIGRLFDRIASSYDLINTILSLGIDRLWRSKTVAALKIKDGDTVLDIATGTGMLALAALRKAGCRVIGVDLSSGMLAKAKIRLQAYIENKRFIPVKANALDMPFPDNSFNKMMICFGMRNIPDIQGFLRECHMILSPDGIMSIMELSIPENRLIRYSYLIYFRFILPFLGGLLSGDYGSYRYLRDSVIAFPSPAELTLIMHNCGFEILKKTPVFFGTAHLYLLKKPLL